MIKAEVVDRQDLTPQEARILAKVCEGNVDKVIAQQFAISLRTLETHLQNVYTKMQVRGHSINSRSAAIATAITRGMIRLTNTSLCVALMVGAMQIDDQALRVKGRAFRPSVARVRSREA